MEKKMWIKISAYILFIMAAVFYNTLFDLGVSSSVIFSKMLGNVLPAVIQAVIIVEGTNFLMKRAEQKKETIEQ